jgi:hypothetical protein
MYYQLLFHTLDPVWHYNIYLDIKDNLSSYRTEKLKDILNVRMEIIEKIQHVRSHELDLLQLCDLFIGNIPAFIYDNRPESYPSFFEKPIYQLRIKRIIPLIQISPFHFQCILIFHPQAFQLPLHLFYFMQRSRNIPQYHEPFAIFLKMTALIAIIIIYPRPTHDFKDKKIKANLSNFYLKTKPKHIFSLYIAKSLIWR